MSREASVVTQDWFIKNAINGVLVGAVSTAGYNSLLIVLHTYWVAMVEQNLTTEWVAVALCVVPILLYVIGLFAGMTNVMTANSFGFSDRYNRPWVWVSEQTNRFITPFTVWVVVFVGIAPLIALSFEAFGSYQYDGVPAGFIRVTNGGSVLANRDFAVSDPYVPRSVLVPLESEINYTTVIGRPSDTARVTGQASLRIGLNPAPYDRSVRELFGRSSAPLGFGEPLKEQKIAQEKFFASALRTWIDPKLQQVVADVESGKISGSPASMLLHFRELMSADPAGRPPWLGLLRVSSVSVPEWTYE